MSKNIIGCRVIRGPDWTDGDVDGGVGCLGTVVNVYMSKNKVKVIWDYGNQHNIYDAGYNNIHQLRIYDNGPAGVVHSSVTCDYCHMSPLTGIRWKCKECHDFDLCTTCFMSKRHSPNHSFIRYVTDNSTVSLVTCQYQLRQEELHGILVGAHVTRGIDWERGNEDGDSGDPGIVEKLTKWGINSYMGGVIVKWSNNYSNEYRLGADGCVDLLCVKETKIYPVIPELLPLLNVKELSGYGLMKGDKIKIIDDMSALEKVLKEMNNWSGGIEKYLKQEGTVIETGGHLTTVQYTSTQKWHIPKAFLIKVYSFSVNELVQIVDISTDKMIKLQVNHGGWNPEMEKTKCKTGQIEEIDKDGDFHVKVLNKTWCFNPVCIDRVSSGSVSQQQLNIDQSSDSSSFTETNDIYEDVLTALANLQKLNENIVAFAAQGDLNGVKRIIEKNQNKVDELHEDKSALQVACFKGHLRIVQYLIEKGASLQTYDNDGDGPLHCAVSGEKNLEIVQLLCSKGVDINKGNSKDRTPIHLAVCQKNYQICEYLLSKQCAINTKDIDGDSPFHDAVSLDTYDIVSLFLQRKDLDMNVCNEDGLTPVHLAIKEKIPEDIFEKILTNIKNIDSYKTVNGCWTPLHVAILNGHIEKSKILLKRSSCNANTQDESGKTALHLAVIADSEALVDMVLFKGADINSQDKDGNTPAHYSVQNKISLIEKNYQSILSVSRHDDTSTTQVIDGIAYTLANAGANLMIKNKEGKSVLDYCSKPTKELLRRLMKNANHPSSNRTPEYWMPMGQNERPKKVLLDKEEEEYNNIIKLFLKTSGNRRVVNIERIQNIDRWEAFMTKKRSMERSYGVGCTNEKLLFHGTKPDIVPRIIAQGLDTRELNTGLYGAGIYFAKDAKTSDNYTTVDKNNYRYMFVVKVLVGKVTRGHKEMKKPPAQDPYNPDILFDSAVDDLEQSRIYVIFDNSQCYTEYLITYQ